MSDSPPAPRASKAWWRLWWQATLLISIALILVYAVPSLARFRPWHVDAPAEDEKDSASRWLRFPLLRLYIDDAQELETSPWLANSETSAAHSSQSLDTLGASVAEQLKTTTQHTHQQGKTSSSTSHSSALPRKEEYAGIEVLIEDPSGQGMAAFYDTLQKTAEGKKGALTRIAHYGDSSIATDLITHTVRRLTQQRFGDGGHGFVLIAKGYMPYRHRDVNHDARNSRWSLTPIMNGGDKQGRYGYGGIRYRSRPGAWALFGSDTEGPVGGRVSRFEIFFQRHPRGGMLDLLLDGQVLPSVSTHSETIRDDFHSIPVAEGEHTLELRHGGGGSVHAYGVVLEREGPGIVYDSLGLVGARAWRLLNYDPEHIKAQIKHRGVDLLILGFGGNESGDPMSRFERYVDFYTQVIQRMRADNPKLGCLMFAPLDQAKRDDLGRIKTLRTIPRIVDAQRQAALSQGCAFYNTFAAMGGKGAMRRWFRSRPRLAMGDFRHATPKGYEVIGSLFYKALLHGFANHLQHKLVQEP